MNEFRINMSDEPGSLAEHCEAIASEDVNILAIVAILTDNVDSTASALDRMGADYSVSELKSAKLEHKPGSLAAFTRGMGNSGVNLRSLYVMSIDGDSATIGYTTE